MTYGEREVVKVFFFCQVSALEVLHPIPSQFLICKTFKNGRGPSIWDMQPFLPKNKDLYGLELVHKGAFTHAVSTFWRLGFRFRIEKFLIKTQFIALRF